MINERINYYRYWYSVFQFVGGVFFYGEGISCFASEKEIGAAQRDHGPVFMISGAVCNATLGWQI